MSAVVGYVVRAWDGRRWVYFRHGGSRGTDQYTTDVNLARIYRTLKQAQGWANRLGGEVEEVKMRIV